MTDEIRPWVLYVGGAPPEEHKAVALALRSAKKYEVLPYYSLEFAKAGFVKHEHQIALVIMNAERFWTPLGKTWASELLQRGMRVMVLDEAPPGDQITPFDMRKFADGQPFLAKVREAIEAPVE